jgi:prepilin-type N-terminal cleavage/methylation domain-containing protein
MKLNKMAFTLIELLVAVLIIGILAAIALPQYQKIIIKARMAEIMTVGKAVKEAEERFFLANSSYASSFEDLDINIAGTVSGKILKSKNYQATLDLGNGRVYFNPSNRSLYDSISFCFDMIKDMIKNIDICKPNLSKIICAADKTKQKQTDFCSSFNPAAARVEYGMWYLYSI